VKIQVWEREIDKQIEDMLHQNIIRHSRSPYNSPFFLVEKKNETHSNLKKNRMMVDWRKLNEVTIDKFPMPNIQPLPRSMVVKYCALPN